MAPVLTTGRSEPAAAEPLVNQPPRQSSSAILLLMALAAVALFACSAMRHYVMRSGAFDLGFFDQAVFLISRGQEPISSLHGFHVLGDHAALILYPLSLLYWIWPNPLMLLAAQAIILAAGAWPIWHIACSAGLHHRRALAVAGAYLAFPVILAANVFDFHPEVVAIPSLLMAILAWRQDRRAAFCCWLAVVLACKEVLGLTVAGMGVWLLLADRRRFYGLFALFAGVAWFIFATKFIIPYFGQGRSPSGLNYYTYLGNSIGEVILSLFLKPSAVLAHIFSKQTVFYLLVLLVPVLWGLRGRAMLPLLAALPTVLLNILSDNPSQRSPFYQYSLSVVPFIFMAAILALAANRAWLVRARAIVAWSLTLLVLGLAARLGKMSSQQAMDWQRLADTRQAIERIDGGGSVLTTFEIVPHVSRRTTVEYIGGVVPLKSIDLYDYVLLNVNHSSLNGDDQQREVSRVLATLVTSPAFEPAYVAPDVFLFKRTNTPPALMAAAWTN